jgi:two-component system sensor histidine kinase RegB
LKPSTPPASRRPYAIAEPHISTAIWLSQLRWVAIAGQLLVIGTVQWFLQIQLPLAPLLILVTWTTISNIALRYWAKRLEMAATAHTPIRNTKTGLSIDDNIGSRVLTAILCMDVATLTGLLYYTGGASNPFLIFYFANIAIAGMILPRRLAWLIAMLSFVGIIVLLNQSIEIPVISNSPLAHTAPWGVAKFAFLVAFATCCSVITYFVTMLAGELRAREIQLAVAETERERARRLEALATLAAGTGHELASPLSTIAVVTKELSRNLEKYEVSASVRRDVELIREELNRCKEILHRMKSGAGEAAAENLRPVSMEEIVKTAIDAMREPTRILIDLPPEIAKKSAVLPKQAISQAIRNLLQNGLDASPEEEKVQLKIREVRPDTGTNSVWKITITDRGSGLSDEVSRRIGEPFFTTKEVGQGMGLGVFLTRNVIHGVGGTIEFESPESGGTVCTIQIPTQS